MEGKHEFKRSGASSPINVEVILGDPAIVINGVPKPSPEFFHDVDTDTAVRRLETHNAPESNEHFLQGQWLKGRQVVKKFRKKNYKGKVAGFDPHTKWYTVIYQDGDSEEMEWKDLQRIMLPLDIKSPIKKWLLNLSKAGIAKTAPKVRKAKAKSKSKGKVKNKGKYPGRAKLRP